jgi:hypothetical protein
MEKNLGANKSACIPSPTFAPTMEDYVGTEFGEHKESRVGTTKFTRENPTRPTTVFVPYLQDEE